MPLPADERAPLTYHVATNGNDAWSGGLAAPNAARTDGPFATLQRARDAIRELKTDGQSLAPVTVVLRKGTYYLDERFRLEPQDSGTTECPITYAPYPGERAIVSGARVLTGWRRREGHIWACSLKEQGLSGLRFRQLFYRGERQIIARWPNRDPVRPRTGGFLYCGTPVQVGSGRLIRYTPGAFPRQWKQPTEVEVVIFPWHGWSNPTVPIASIDRQQRVITLSRDVSPIREGNRFYVQNAFEELDAPGEWCLDRQTETVYFRPPDGKSPDGAVVVPALEHVVELAGDFDSGKYVEYVEFSHLGLECSESHAVLLEAARHCALVGCTVRKAGDAGIVLGPGSSHCRIAGNDVPHPGGHAIAMHYDVVSPQACTDCVITNNYAHHCGEIKVCSFGWGSGICISGHRNTVSHNLVHDTAYSAICFDGYDHMIEYNHVHHANLECHDGDGIYGWVNTKGGSGRSVVRHNRVHDVVGFSMVRPGEWRSPYHSLGIRADDYLSHTTIYGNLVYRVPFGCVCLHGGWDNSVENNILVDGALGQVRLPNMRRDKPSLSGLTGKDAPGEGEWTMSGHVVRRNILGYSSPDSAAYHCPVGWEDRILAEANQNLIWCQSGAPRVNIVGWPEEGSWERWLAGGRDTESLVDDPLFVDPAHDDYRLRPDSPALKLGFEPLPVEQMGLVESPERASWPVVEPKVYRDPPPLPPPLPPPADMPIGRAYHTSGPVTIDGVLSPEEWGDTGGTRALIVDRLADGSDLAALKTRLHVLWDAENLYLGAVNEVSDRNHLGDAAGPWEKADGIEVAFGSLSQLASGHAFRLRGYPSGRSRVEAVGPGSSQAARKVRAAATYASRTSAGRWTCEWAIPFAACGIDRAGLHKLRLNVRVHRSLGKQVSAWYAVPEGQPEEAVGGLLTFAPSIGVGANDLLVNGSFEEGEERPTGWSTAERITGELPAGATKPKCLWVDEGREGSRCLKLEATDPAAMTVSECWWHQTLDRPAAGTYVMPYDVRARDIRPHGGNGRFYACGWASMKEGIEPRGINLGYSPENQIDSGGTRFWTRRECVLDVPPDVERLHVIFGIIRATGTVWIDNVRLESATSSSIAEPN